MFFKKEEKLSVRTPYYGNHNIYNIMFLPYPIDEVKRFFDAVKPLLVGQKLDEVLVYGYCSGDVSDQSFSFDEYDLTSCEWEGPFVFVINKQCLEVDIMANNHYGIALNYTEIKKVVNTKNKPKKDVVDLWCEGGPYLDISHIFFDNVLKQKIVDIELTPGNEEVIIEKEKYQYLENIIIKFENGYSLLIEEGLDNPVIHIIRNKENM